MRKFSKRMIAMVITAVLTATAAAAGIIAGAVISNANTGAGGILFEAFIDPEVSSGNHSYNVSVSIVGEESGNDTNSLPRQLLYAAGTNEPSGEKIYCLLFNAGDGREIESVGPSSFTDSRENKKLDFWFHNPDGYRWDENYYSYYFFNEDYEIGGMMKIFVTPVSLYNNQSVYVYIKLGNNSQPVFIYAHTKVTGVITDPPPENPNTSAIEDPNDGTDPLLWGIISSLVIIFVGTPLCIYMAPGGGKGKREYQRYNAEKEASQRIKMYDKQNR